MPAQFLGLLSSIASWVFVIVIIIAVRKSKKKKAERKRQADIDVMVNKFKTSLQNHIKSFETNDEYFETIFCAFMETNNLDKKFIDEIMSKVPELKIKIENLYDSLIAISDKNLYLNDKLREETSFQDKKTLYTSHTIELLTILADHCEAYNMLHKTLYDDFMVKRLQRIMLHTFAIRLDDAKKEYKDETTYENVLHAHYDHMIYNFNYEVDLLIRAGFNLDYDYDVRNSDDPMIKILLQAAEECNLHGEFGDIWFNKMQSISKRYVDVQLDLLDFFQNIDAKMSQYFDSFSLWDGVPSECYDLRFAVHSKEDYLRIIQLYQTGQMQGEYYTHKDPNFRT